jgi:hypothetical protein
MAGTLYRGGFPPRLLRAFIETAEERTPRNLSARASAGLAGEADRLLEAVLG